MVLTLTPDGLFGIFLGLAAFAFGRAAWRGLRHGTPRQHAAWLGIVCAASLGAFDGLWSAISLYRETYEDLVPGTWEPGAAWKFGYAMLAGTMALYVVLGDIAIFLLRVLLALLPLDWQVRLMGEVTSER